MSATKRTFIERKQRVPTRRWIRPPRTIQLLTPGSSEYTFITFNLMIVLVMSLLIGSGKFLGEVGQGITFATSAFGTIALFIWIQHRNEEDWNEVNEAPGDIDRLKRTRRQLLFIKGVKEAFAIPVFFGMSAVVLAWTGKSVLPFQAPASFGMIAWLALRAREASLHGTLHWSSAVRMRVELEGHMKAFRSGDALEVENFSTIGLNHLDILSKIASSDLPYVFQFPRLGLRPETEDPLPWSYWVDIPEDEPAEWPDLKTVREFEDANDKLIESVKLLIQLGLTSMTTDRLEVTLSGREALALPPSFFVSRMPAPTRAELARADMKFHSRDYEGCALICGTSLERFLKAAIKQIHPDESGRNRFLNSLPLRAESIETLGLGQLVFVMTSYLDVNQEVDELRRKKMRDDLSAVGFSLGVSCPNYSEPARKEFANLIGPCVALRNAWSHDKGHSPLAPAKVVEHAYRLLHLSRMAVSSFCSESRIDPFFVPSRTTTADAG